ALDRALRLGGTQGPYALQAAIAACHARAGTAAETDWPEIARLYGELARTARGDGIAASPVIELNRAVAVAMAEGPAAGLAILDRLAGDRSLEGYHLLPAARGDLLDKLGRREEAGAEFERAAALTRNLRERDVLLGRAARCAGTA